MTWIANIFAGFAGALITLLFYTWREQPKVSLSIHMPEGESGAGKVFLEIKNISSRSIKELNATGKVHCYLNNRDYDLFGKHEDNRLELKTTIAPQDSISVQCDLVSGVLTTHHQTNRLISLSLQYDDDFFLWCRNYSEEHKFIIDLYMNDYRRNALVYDLDKIKKEKS